VLQELQELRVIVEADLVASMYKLFLLAVPLAAMDNPAVPAVVMHRRAALAAETRQLVVLLAAVSSSLAGKVDKLMAHCPLLLSSRLAVLLQRFHRPSSRTLAQLAQ
jgi:hypothetical protein